MLIKIDKSFYTLETGVTQSILASFMACREMTYLNLQGWSKRGLSGALVYGSIVHEVLAIKYHTWMTHGKEAQAGLDLDTLIDDAQDKIKDEYDGELLDKDHEQLEFAAGLASGVLPIYFRYAEKFDDKIKWSQLETTFNIPFQGTNVRGRFDGVFNYGKNLWLFETKTMSRMNEDNIMQMLPLNLQVQVYLWALNEQTGKRPTGVLYNVLRKPAARRKVNESLPVFINRCIEDIEKRPEFYFIRFECPITPKEQIDWQRDTFSPLVKDYVEWFQGKGNHYMNNTNCDGKYGLCKYLPICGENDFSGLSKRKNVFPELVD